jgi:hypothetical protein
VNVVPDGVVNTVLPITAGLTRRRVKTQLEVQSCDGNRWVTEAANRQVEAT